MIMGISKGLIVIVVHLGSVWSPYSFWSSGDHGSPADALFMDKSLAYFNNKKISGWSGGEDVKSLAASTSSATFRHLSRSCNNSAHILVFCFFHNNSFKHFAYQNEYDRNIAKYFECFKHHRTQ
jgi:hypothetical protein